MPNQRSPNKVRLNVWITREQKLLLQAAAQARGMTLTEFLVWVAENPPPFHEAAQPPDR